MEGLLWLLAFGVFFYFMMRHGCGAHMVHGSHQGHSHSDGGGQNDPVCGMTVAADAGYSKVHEGIRLAFCSKTCLDKFESDPAKYLPHESQGSSA